MSNVESKVGASRRMGRPNINEPAREMVMLLTLLKPGVTFTVPTVAKALSISESHATRILQNILDISSDWSMCVPLALGEDGQSITLNGNVSYGKQIQLSPAAYQAISQALDLAGIPTNDPLREKISPETPLVVESRATLEAGSAGVLATCMHALYEGYALRFSYMGTNDTEAKIRNVLPKCITPDLVSGMWTLHAFDLDKLADRNFRLARMENVQIDDSDDGPLAAPLQPALEPAPTPAAPLPHTPETQESQTVELVFTNRYVAELFTWNETCRETLPDGRLKLNVSYFRGMWLPRRIAACLPHVTCDNPHVLALAHDWLRTLNKQTALLQAEVPSNQ